MVYVCESCQKKFSLEEPFLMKDLHANRLYTQEGKLFHLSCAKTTREADGSFKLEDESAGLVVRKGA
ncbi:MAG: hypothetical protein AAB368_02860 [bacterium]|mgnify:CR=1 FL=1